MSAYENAVQSLINGGYPDRQAREILSFVCGEAQNEGYRRGAAAARDELAAAVAEHGPFPMPTGDTARRPRRFTPLEEAVRNIETAIAPLKGDARAGADMVLAYLRTLTTPEAVVAELEAATYVAPSPSCTRCYGADAVRFVANGDVTTPCRACAPSELEELRARVAELEALTPAPIQTCRSCGAGYDYGKPCSVCEFKKRIAAEIAKAQVEAPRDLRPGADAARRMIADRQTAEDPHDSPLHRTYETSHDLPAFPGACEACGDTDAQWCPDCAACRKGCHGGHEDNTCTHANAPWRVTS
ncbi:hypothetical protein AB0I87_04530 [Streptomyces sp. NPDC049952]|uniref:hypothetical protein n=1 Tax=Streptomyces sp. NPDC049952 TaxID=3156665 RepID=UPI00342D174A